MVTETATYSNSAVRACIEALKGFSFDAKRLACLEGLEKLEELHNFLYRKTDCLLFNPDWDFYLADFRNAVCYGGTKAEQRKALRQVESYLKNQVADIWAMMQSGEVDTTE